MTELFYEDGILKLPIRFENRVSKAAEYVENPLIYDTSLGLNGLTLDPYCVIFVLDPRVESNNRFF